MSRRIWAAQVSGTCGELAQGQYEGEYGLITAPIDRFATAAAELSKTGADELSWQVPKDFPKVAASLRIAREKAYIPVAGTLRVHSPLPRGKGFGSSTADIAASLAAASLAAGQALKPADIGLIAAAVEPSDGTMFKGVCHFDNRGGRLIRALPAPPPIAVGVLDWGGKVDTCRFHRGNLHADPGRQAAAFGAVIDGLLSGNPWDIGWGATQSALAHQAVLPKPGLEQLVKWVKSADGYGVCVAHSGTIAGILFPLDVCWSEIRHGCERLLPHVSWWGGVSLGGGGIRWAEIHNSMPIEDVSTAWQPWPTPDQ